MDGNELTSTDSRQISSKPVEGGTIASPANTAKTVTCSLCKQPTTNTSYYCTSCMADYQRRYNYGLTREQFDTLLKRQRNRCALCRKPFAGTPQVDHDHKTDTVRGLLCTPCNTGLGKLGDNVQGLLRAAQYVAQGI